MMRGCASAAAIVPKCPEAKWRDANAAQWVWPAQREHARQSGEGLETERD